VCSVCCRYRAVGPKIKEPHTGICLYAGSDLTRTKVIKKGDILAEDSPKVSLTNTLSGHLGGVDPSRHVNVSTEKRGSACNEWGLDRTYSRRHHRNGQSRTDIRQVGSVLGSGMTESMSGLLDYDTRFWAVRDVSDGGVEIDKALDKITK